LRYFLEIAEKRSITRAAEHLSLGQPALSKSVRKLERQLNLTLFARDRNGVTLTRAGENLYAKLRKWAGEWEDIRTEVTRANARIQGEFTLGCHPAIGRDFLPLFLPELMLRHPELRWKIAHDTSRRTLERVLDRKIDFGLVIDPLPFPDLTFVKLHKEFVGLWTARKPTALGRAGSPRSILYYNPDMTAAHALFDLIAAHRLSFHQLVPVNDYEVIAGLVESGGGIGILPSHVANRSTALVRIGNHGLRIDADLCLVFRADSQRSSGSRAIVEQIRKRIREEKMELS
jgi:DNA-binding transcriptional LysR family regulator